MKTWVFIILAIIFILLVVPLIIYLVGPPVTVIPSPPSFVSLSLPVCDTSNPPNYQVSLSFTPVQNYTYTVYQGSSVNFTIADLVPIYQDLSLSPVIIPNLVPGSFLVLAIVSEYNGVSSIPVYVYVELPSNSCTMVGNNSLPNTTMKGQLETMLAGKKCEMDYRKRVECVAKFKNV